VGRAQVSPVTDVLLPVIVVEDIDVVRCTECRQEYEQPERGEDVACPDCGSPTWVSARIPAEFPEPQE
jgi:DNA-directed RNA polymerase subunit RPC12/RpoP